MGNELQTARQFEIVITSEQKELVRRTIAPDATDAELQLFFYDCTRRGVHPLDKLIHFTKRNGKYTPITSIDMFRQRAGESGEHMGTDDAVYTSEHGKPDFAASVTVYKFLHNEKCAFTATARWSEYFPGEKQGFMWQKMPHLMLAKCAEALALRKAFPAQLHGLYTPEEMAQADVPSPSKAWQSHTAHTDKYTGEPRQADNAQHEASDPPVKAATLDTPAPSHAWEETTETRPAPSAAEYCKQKAEAMSDSPIFTFGKHKGKTPFDETVPDDYLSWIEPMLAKQVNDPVKARYQAVNQALLDAVRAALIDRNAMPLDT